MRGSYVRTSILAERRSSLRPWSEDSTSRYDVRDRKIERRSQQDVTVLAPIATFLQEYIVVPLIVKRKFPNLGCNASHWSSGDDCELLWFPPVQNAACHASTVVALSTRRTRLGRKLHMYSEAWLAFSPEESYRTYETAVGRSRSFTTIHIS